MRRTSTHPLASAVAVLVSVAVLAPSRAPAQDAARGSPAPAADFADAVARAGAALAAGEDARARDLLRTAHAIVPGHPRVLLYLARTELAAGDTARAIAALEALAAQGAVRDLLAEPVIGELRGHPAFERARASIAARAEPVVQGDTAFALPDTDFLPEGIAHDPVDDAFYVGSLHRGSIVRVDRHGAVHPFSELSPGERVLVAGLRVDAERRRLWAAALVVDSAAARFRQGIGGRASIRAFDLASGRQLAAYAPAEPGPHLLNDLAIARDGTVWVTDSEGQGVYRLRPAADALERVWRDTVNFTYPNGIALSPDGSLLYVAHAEGVSVLHTAAPERGFARMPSPPGVATSSFDGLYACRGALVGLQPMLGFSRVGLLELDATGTRIVGQQSLEQRHPAHDIPTTGVFARGAFFYVAGSQLGRLGADQSVAPAETPRASVVLRLPSPPACAGGGGAP